MHLAETNGNYYYYVHTPCNTDTRPTSSMEYYALFHPEQYKKGFAAIDADPEASTRRMFAKLEAAQTRMLEIGGRLRHDMFVSINPFEDGCCCLDKIERGEVTVHGNVVAATNESEFVHRGKFLRDKKEQLRCA